MPWARVRSSSIRGAAFDTKGLNVSAHPFSIAGTGVNGSGVLFNSGIGTTTTVSSLALLADATVQADTFGSANATNGRMDIRGGTALLDLAGHTLTKTGNAQFSIVAGNITSGTIEVNGGNFAIQTTTIARGTGLIDVNSSVGGTILSFWNNPNGNITMPIQINGSGNIIGNAASGAGSLAVINSPITLNGDLTISNAIPNNATTCADHPGRTDRGDQRPALDDQGWPDDRNPIRNEYVYRRHERQRRNVDHHDQLLQRHARRRHSVGCRIRGRFHKKHQPAIRRG